jgi:hypothetical protein
MFRDGAPSHALVKSPTSNGKVSLPTLVLMKSMEFDSRGILRLGSRAGDARGTFADAQRRAKTFRQLTTTYRSLLGWTGGQHAKRRFK